MTGDYQPRFIFDISDEQKTRADKILTTYGVRRAIFSKLLDEVLDLIEEYGGVAVGIMLTGNVKLKEIIPSMKKADTVGKIVKD